MLSDSSLINLSYLTGILLRNNLFEKISKELFKYHIYLGSKCAIGKFGDV